MRKVLSILVIVSLVLCGVFAVAPTVSAYSVDLDPTADTILNATTQSDLIELVVFAFTIGIIMTILGFAMGIMWTQRRGR